MSEILAEARVLVLPDTSAFRATLLGELNAIQASIKPIVVPIASAGASGVVEANAAVVASTEAATEAAVTQAGGERQRAAAAVKSEVALIQLAKAETLNAEAGARLAGATEVASLKTTELAKARAILSETSGAVAIAERAVAAAVASGNAALITATGETLALAKAQETAAVSAVKATIAEGRLAATTAERAAAQAAATRGAAATGLSLFGLRGATLAANKEFLAGAVAVTIFAKSLSLAAGFEQELNVFRVTAKATNEDLQRVSETAKQLGADITLPAVSAKDAAEAMTELAKAGLSIQDSIDGARGVLQLATAAEIDNAAATQIAANALNAFGLGGDQAVHVADLLANASIEAQGSISDMGAALTATAAVSKLVGISLDDTVALITILAKAGLAGARGGTALKVALLRLVAPSVAAKKVIGDLGITLRDAQGNLRPDVFAQFAEATGKLAPKIAQADAAIVFGTRGIQAASIAGRAGADGLNAMQIATERQGAAAEIAGARTAGFAGQTQALQSNLETLGITLGTLTLGPLTAFLQKINDGLGILNKFSDQVVRIGGIKIPPVDIKVGPVNVEKDSTDAGTVAGRVFGVAFNIAKDKAVTALVPLAQPIELTSSAVNRLGLQQKQLQGDAKETAKDINAIFDAFRKAGGGATSLNDAVVALQKMSDKLKGGDEEAQRLGVQIDKLIKGLQDTGKIPPVKVPIQAFLAEVPKIDIPPFPAKITFDAPETAAEARVAALAGGNAALDSLKSTLGPDGAKVLGFDWMTNFGDGAAAAAPDAGKKAGTAFKVSLGGELAIAEASGTSDSALLASLREREARDQAFFDRFNAIPNRTKGQQATLEKAAVKLNDDRAAIQKILDGEAADQRDAASKAKTAADNITKARNEADQNVLDAFSAVLAKPKRLLARAAGTKPLADDIKFAKKILGIINDQIKAAARDIKDAKTRRETLDRLLTDRLNIQKTISDLVKNRQEAIRKAAEDRRTRLREGLQLDIDFAATKGNVQGEIRAHLRLLVQLQKDLIRVRKQYGKNSNEAKEVRNAIATEQKAIEDLRGTTKGRNDAFSKLTFEFLQTQSGFAANLLGNLIPGGATGGLVGGVAGPSTRGAGGAFPGALLPQEHGRGGSPADDLRKANVMVSGGPSRAGQATTNQLLRDMRALLRHIYAGTGHPEAKHRQKRNLAAMELAGRI